VSEELVAGLPNARLQVLDGRSASLFFEDTGTVVETIVAFIEDRAPALAPSRRPGIGPDGLSPRELEVLRLVAAGDSNGEIAARLGLSIHTVERHVANLYRKIDARGRADATAYAIRSGLAT
jgi:DNA-binding CsgD family transcriptional regulator